MNHMLAPQKILVRAPNWIGDQILAYPCFHYLRAGYPTAQITVVCQPWVASVQFRHLVDEVYVLPQPKRASIWGRVQALDRTQPLLPMTPGQAGRGTHDYVRDGTTARFAASRA